MQYEPQDQFSNDARNRVMGAWGLKSFENDEACDWLIDFEDHGVKFVRSAFDAVAGAYPGSLATGLECHAIAAAEIVAAVHDGDTSRLPDRADAALEKHGNDVKAATLAPVAVNVIERIMNNSELRDLWEDVDALDNWLADLAPLKSRLKP